MKTNKAISILLTLTMIFSMFVSAVPVSAAEGDPITYNFSVEYQALDYYGELTEERGNLPDVSMALTSGDEWTTSDEEPVKSVSLTEGEEYTLTVHFEHQSYQRRLNYEIKFTADGSMDWVYDYEGVDIAEATDDNGNVTGYDVTLTLLKYPDGVTNGAESKEGSILFYQRDKTTPMTKVTGYYETYVYDEYDENSPYYSLKMGAFTVGEEGFPMDWLIHGQLTDRVHYLYITDIEPKDGYKLPENGYIQFRVNESGLYVHDSSYEPSTGHGYDIFDRDETNRVGKYETPSWLIYPEIGVRGWYKDIAYEVYSVAEDDTETRIGVYQFDGDWYFYNGTNFFEPGNYKLYCTDTADGYIIPEQNYIEFTVNDDYSATVTTEGVDTEIELDWNRRTLTWYLEATSSTEINVSVATNNDLNFKTGASVSVYKENNSTALVTETLDTSSKEAAVNWKLPAADSYGNSVTYVVKYSDKDGEQEIPLGDDGIYTASVEGGYTIYIGDSNIENGTVTANTTLAGADETITLTLEAADGYMYSENTLIVYDTTNDGRIEVQEVVTSDNTKQFTFTMPAGDVEVYASFEALPPHSHPVCGATCAGDHDGEYGSNGSHTESIEWTALTQQIVTDAGDTAAITLADGNYYLAENIPLGEHYFTTTGTVNICLNGYTMSTEDAEYCIMLDAAAAVMNLTDCGTTGTVDSSASGMSSALQISNGSTINIYGGTYGGTGTAQWYTAELTTDGVLKLYNGTLKDEAKTYGCVYVDGGSFYMYGGTVSGEYRNVVSVGPNSNDAFAYIYGGTLSAGSTNEYPIIDLGNGELHIAGAPVFDGTGEHIRLTNLGSGNNLHIDGPLTASTPISINDMYGGNDYYDFTTGWKTHMSTAYAPEFFSNYYYNYDSMVPAVNEKTGELHFVLEAEAPKKITVDSAIVNGTVEAPAAANEGAEVTLTVTPADGYAVKNVTFTDGNGTATNADVDATDATKYTFTMPATEVTVSAAFSLLRPVTINGNIENGTITADKATAIEEETITLTATPDEFYKLETLTVTDDTTGDVILSVPSAEGAALFAAADTYSFEMPASSVTVDATFALDTSFTVKAVTNTTNADQDDTTDVLDVYAGENVYVDIVVEGGDYTNADWTLVYDSNKFEYVENSATVNTNYDGITAETQIQKNVLTGNIRSSAVNYTNALQDGDYVVTYTFKAVAQSADNVTGSFEITSAHVNSYDMAGNYNNYPASTDGVDVNIIFVTEDEDPTDDVTPAGTFADEVLYYDGKLQAGKPFEPNADYENLTIVYAANPDGSPIADIANTTDIAWNTALPTWKEAGEYYYYVRVSGNGFATIYDEAVLTIKPIQLAPTATFEVDPDVNEVVIIPMLTGAVDNNGKGVVSVTYTDDGADTTITYDLSNEDDRALFKFDGEDTMVGPEITAKPARGGDYTVTVKYEPNASGDNYLGGEDTATVNVDKLTAPDTVVTTIDGAITNIFEYDTFEHGADLTADPIIVDAIDAEAIAAIADGTWTLTSTENAFDSTGATTVRNVGDQVLVKLTFTDSTEVYNDVVIYAALKVIPVNIVIDVADDHKKTVGDADPTGDAFRYTIYKADENGAIAKDTDGNDIVFALFEENDLGEITYTREPGEAAGIYEMTAHYVPNANYNVTTIEGYLEIVNPEIGGEDGKILIEVVDFEGIDDGTANYIAGRTDGTESAKRLILVYTDIDKLYFTYNGGQMLYDVTDAGYKYIDNIYNGNELTQEEDEVTEYRHIYGIIVDADVEEDTTVATREAREEVYISRVAIATPAEAEEVKPEKITYDADINCTGERDVNDYSMAEGIYNVVTDYDTVGAHMKNALKADFNGDKVIDTEDTIAVRALTDPKYTE